ncbi:MULTISPECIES: MerR family transcriptional regulator [unclassified Fusobacterium]|uniref:MerR family transcriptional regulator n=1 Tax=unclassified Fusobacterium TaxID=2648384 RepID=UPI001B8B416E|nr:MULTISPECIES: MerR family transcriptional regulator [unclassified Fusobacterium]MBR8701653.1 hypothetical protein [Fusobacterium sp. DD45]MBR8711434.1 hypothetical protein [Fusobacterium sp. DD28]MBR8751983.1 hypothetical protein [Fusobacterium sp. DD26]
MFEEGMLIRGVELAKLLNITDRYVRQLAKEKILQKSGNKYLLIENIHSYIEYVKSNNSGNKNLKDLKLQKEIEKLSKDVELKEMKIAEIKNELHSAETVKKVMTSMLLNLKGKMLSVPNKVSPLVVGCDNLGDIQNIILENIEDALLELSDYTPELFKTTDYVVTEEEEDDEEKKPESKSKNKKSRVKKDN